MFLRSAFVFGIAIIHYGTADSNVTRLEGAELDIRNGDTLETKTLLKSVANPISKAEVADTNKSPPSPIAHIPDAEYLYEHYGIDLSKPSPETPRQSIHNMLVCMIFFLLRGRSDEGGWG
jgi:hypothetical protein